MLNFILIIIIIILGFLLYKSSKENKTIDSINEKVKNENEQIEKQNQTLNKELEQYQKDIYNATQTLQNLENTTKNSFERYCDVLDENYNKTEQEYQQLINNLQIGYEEKQLEIIRQIQEKQEELNSIAATRTALIKAQIKEKEIKEKKDFYCLQIKEADKQDIKILDKIKPELNQPRILCMLIWSTYFQKPMTQLCNNILGLDTICGIYKITNQKTNECYIGQAVDVAKRWKDHAKCGLGIDTPANNKLYKAIEEYGIWNFSWELLEKCERTQLNEKEKYYIELYSSKEYGYNSSIGISK